MVHIRYSRWDITRRDSLDSDDVFDQLNDNMNDTGDLQQAMRRLMQKGIKQGDKQTKGIDDLLSQVAKEMRKLYDQYRLQSAMDEVQEQLEECWSRSSRPSKISISPDKTLKPISSSSTTYRAKPAKRWKS
jgi:uncharacterized protein with von Willebrand factor type A (vWA) domain